MRTAAVVLWVLVAAAAATVVLDLYATDVVSVIKNGSGPGCPGMDPSYLGACK